MRTESRTAALKSAAGDITSASDASHGRHRRWVCASFTPPEHLQRPENHHYPTCARTKKPESVRKCSKVVDRPKLKRHGTHAYTASINTIPKRGAILSKIKGYHICLFCSKPKLHLSSRVVRTVTPSDPAMGLFCRHCKCTCGAIN